MVNATPVTTSIAPQAITQWSGARTISSAEKAAPPPNRIGQLGLPSAAVKRAPTRAPKPKHAVMIPKTTGPDRRVTVASTGSRTLKLMPKVETTRSSPQVSQAARVCTTQTTPSPRLRSTPCCSSSRSPLYSSAVRISSRLPITARKLAALTAKQMVTPTVAMRTPATAGPAARARLKSDAFSDTALGSSFRPTISKTKAWRAGMSTTCTAPPTAARRKTSHTVACPVRARRARAAALSIRVVWVAMIVVRLSKRSTSGPPSRPKTVYGRNWKAASAPRASGDPVGEWVSSTISHAWAMFCTQVPEMETACPAKKSR